MNSSNTFDRIFFDVVVNSEALCGLKSALDPLFPEGLRWWVASKINGLSKKNGRSGSEFQRIWDETTSAFSHKIAFNRGCFATLRKRRYETAPFFIKRASGKSLLVVPFLLGDRILGILGIEGFTRPPQGPVLKLLVWQTVL